MDCCNDFIPCPIQKGCICDNDNNSNNTLSSNLEKLDLEHYWKTLTSIWICLNLKERVDRFEKCVEQMHAIGLCRVSKFLQTQRPLPSTLKENHITHGGAYGCWETHRKAAMMCVKYNTAIGFLEDDFKVLYTTKTQLLETLSHACELKAERDEKKSYDCFMLGGLTMTGWPSDFSFQFINQCPRVYSACTHAYIATPALVRSLAETPYALRMAQLDGNEESLDWFYIHNFRQCMYVPQFIVQRIDSSQESSKDKRTMKSSDVKTGLESRPVSLLNLLERHLATPTLSFVEHHPALYDIGILVVLPVLVMLVCIMSLYYGLKRWLFSIQPVTIKDKETNTAMNDNKIPSISQSIQAAN